MFSNLKITIPTSLNDEQYLDLIESRLIKEKEKILIIMIAHNGITNPLIWEEWMQNSQNVECHLKILSPPFPEHHKKFCDQYRLGFMRKTQWGSFSIVYETMKAIKMIKEDYLYYFLVSGYDIPIFSLNSWSFQDFYQNRLGTKKNNKCHNQFMGWTNFFFRKIKTKIVKLFEEDPSILIKKFFELNHLLANKYELEWMAPDELWLFYILDIEFNYKDSHSLISYSFFHHKRSQSPVIWKGLDKPLNKVRFQPFPISLRSAIGYIYELGFNSIVLSDSKVQKVIQETINLFKIISYRKVLFIRKVAPIDNKKEIVMFFRHLYNNRQQEISNQRQNKRHEQLMKSRKQLDKLYHLSNINYNIINDTNFVQHDIVEYLNKT